ncbi:cation:dicarboxylate symporter family transporter [Blastopirellula marina]|uniref:Dicarboxylate/amino acid:cation symporter n=1 Tax=Blastopirellula marina TaxID=124 RepID=A0A2S8F592_9BACT|nr:cation:dicarboxylase symporter family transporter [Blastopirellula marina]PQO27094.1 dicarboxylate/amino acid:cation symporter [Blastopirellula marina]PTL41241.1 dicarboxylate/amino acid:cation symporter [Blastopirellula marina]
MTETNQPAQHDNSVRGLILILLGIFLGVLLGLFYGKTMWLASEGPEKQLTRLEQTIEQKEKDAASFRKQAEQATDPQEQQRLNREAGRLEGHIPTIQTRLDALKKEVQVVEADKAAGKYGLARTVWIFCEFCGDIFLQVLKLLVIPLVVTSMISGITSLGDIRKMGRVGLSTIIYYFSTGAIAVFIGIVLVVIIQPGISADDTFAYRTDTVDAKEGQTTLEVFLDVFRGRKGDAGSGMFPSNLFEAATDTNVLALIVFAIVFGGALTTLGEEGMLVIRFFNVCNEAVMKMVHLVMLFAPIGIFGLVSANIAKNGGGAGFLEQLHAIGWYVATVVIGLAIHSIVLATLLWALGKRNPFVYTFNLLRALLTSVSTASSAATLPVTMECVEENNGVSNRAASFVLPLGATINMDGTALYEAVAVIFIAQTLGIDLDMADLVIVFLTASLAAVGAAGIPEAGLVTMVIVLQAVGLPMTGIGTILAIDWFLDRLRTTVNVYGDACGAGIIDTMVVQKQAVAEG